MFVFDAAVALMFDAMIYFAPTLIARSRKHPKFSAIFALNLFAGWTIIGWIGALVWALIRPRRALPPSHQTPV